MIYKVKSIIFHIKFLVGTDQKVKETFIWKINKIHSLWKRLFTTEYSVTLLIQDSGVFWYKRSIKPVSEHNCIIREVLQPDLNFVTLRIYRRKSENQKHNEQKILFHKKILMTLILYLKYSYSMQKLFNFDPREAKIILFSYY